MKVVSTPLAPQAIGPYSQAMIAGNLMFTSGQIALKSDGTMCEDEIVTQSKQVLSNLSEVLKAGGSSLDKVVKTTIFLANMDDFSKVNEVYAQFFGKHKPARSTVAVKTLPRNALVEIDAIAII